MPQLPRNFNTEISSVKRDPYLLVMAGDRLLNPDEILQTKGRGQYALYDELLKDGHCYSILQKRYLSIISREWQVEPASKDKIDQKAADMVKYHLSSLSARAPEEDVLATGFDRTCYNLLDATLKGFKPAEIIWNEDGKEFYPAQIKTRNQQRFDFALGENSKWELRLLTTDNLIDGEPVAKLYPKKFFVHIFGGSDDNPYGVGLGRSLWWNVFFKKQGIKFWLQFIDKFASPTAVGKYPRGATKEQKSSLMDALLAIATDAGVSIPEDLEIMLLEASRSGSINCYESLCGYMDTEMSKTVLGETLTTQLGSTGSYSASQTHNEVRKELSKADSDLLSDTLNRTLIKWDVELNMPDAKPPRLWRNFEEAQDLDKRVTRDKTLFDMGFKLKAGSVAEIYGDYYEEAQQEDGQGGQVTDEQFLANSGADAATDGENEDTQPEETTDLTESLDYGSIIDRVLRWNNLPVGVEYLPGAVRFPGRKHSKKLRSGYGHLRGYKGNDREALDCYIYPGLLKPEPEGSDRLFLITQLSPEDGDFDEYKVLIGYANVKAARDAYLQEMPIDYLGGVKEITLADLEQFRRQPLVNLSDSFAENKPDPADLYTQQLQERSRPIITNWINQIRSLIEGSESLEEVRDRLFDLYPELDSNQFTELMGAAMVAAEAAGRYEVIQETGDADLSFSNPYRDGRGRFAKKGTRGSKSTKPSKSLDDLTEEIYKENLQRYRENGSYKYMRIGGRSYNEILRSEGQEAADKALEEHVRKSARNLATESQRKEAIEADRERITSSNDKQLKRELEAFDRLYPEMRNQSTLEEFKAKNPNIDLLTRLDAEEKLDKALSHDSIMNRGAKITKKLDRQIEKAQTDDQKIEAMDNFRNELLQSNMTKADAIALVDSKTFDSSIDKWNAAIVKDAASEFYQMTEGAGSSTLQTFKQDEARAYANKDSKSVNIGAFPVPETIWHEMGHHLEYEDPRIAKAARDWRDKRATGEAASLGSRFGEDEVAKPGNYIDPYVGKVYAAGTTEVISMAIQHFHSAQSMLDLYTKDKEHFQFVTGVIKRG